MPPGNTLVQLLALYIDTESHNAQRHRQMDRQTNDSILPIADHTVLQYYQLKIPHLGHFILIDAMNSIILFNKYKKLFHFWLLAKKIEKFVFCPKNNDFAQVLGGLQPPSTPWLARL